MDTFFKKKLVEFRRDIHKNPELGLEEYRTKEKIKEFIHSNNFKDIIIVEVGTGLWLDIIGKGQKANDTPFCIALRTEMDALSSTENTELEWSSCIKGMHHGCGHDGHMACLLGALYNIYHYHLDEIPKNYKMRFIFQPGEEYHAGAKKMIEAGCLDGVNEIYGMHNWQGELGTLFIKSGPVMAHEMSFLIKIHGKGGHASAPHTTNDPIVTAAQIILNLQTVVSRNISGTDTGVLSVTMMNAGESYNVIPSSAELKGTIRVLSSDISLLIKERMISIVKNTSMMNNCFGEILFNTDQPEYPVLINYETQTEKILEMGFENSLKTSSEGLPILGAEDFSFYLEKIPGCFFFLGNGMTVSCHNDSYDFNDELIEYGVNVWVELILFLLKN